MIDDCFVKFYVERFNITTKKTYHESACIGQLQHVLRSDTCGDWIVAGSVNSKLQLIEVTDNLNSRLILELSTSIKCRFSLNIYIYIYINPVGSIVSIYGLK